MGNYTRFFSALEGALSALHRDRLPRYKTAAFTPIQTRLKENYAATLRDAAGKVTELDVDVMEDLMRIVKKLGKQSTPAESDVERRFRLSLELLDYVLDKRRPTAPDHVLWVFNKLYLGLMRTIPIDSTVPTEEGVAA